MPVRLLPAAARMAGSRGASLATPTIEQNSRMPFKKPMLRWPTSSLRSYLVIVILLATVPIAALVPYQIYVDVEGQKQSRREEMQQAAASLAAAIEREIASTADALTILATVLQRDAGTVTDLERTFGHGVPLRPSWSGTFLARTDGNVLTSAGPSVRPDADTVALLRRDEVQAAIGNGRTALSDLISAGEHEHHTAIVVPLQIEGSTRFVVGAWIDSRVWQKVLSEGALPPNAFASVFDRKDRVIARTREPEASVGRTLPPSVIAIKRGQPRGVARTELLHGGATYAAWEPVTPAGWGVGVGIPAEPLDAAQRRAIALPLATAGACLLLGVLLALYVARRVTVPLHQLATKGTALPPGPIAVLEIAALRDALIAARVQDERARELLQKKADEFETLFNSSPLGLAFAQDAQCRDVLHNTAMATGFGQLTDGKRSVRVLHAGVELEPGQQPLQRAAAHGESTASLELELVVDGEPPKFVLANAAPLLDANGRPRGAIGAVVDITDRKLTEARLLSVDRRLHESQRLVDLAQEAGHVGFFHYHYGRDLLGWTPGQAKLFGIDPTVDPNPTLDVWAERIDETTRRQIELSLHRMLDGRHETETLEFRVVLPDGTSRWLSNRLLMSYDEAGQPVQLVGITVDLTDRKQAEHERDMLMEREQAARQQAEAANRAKDEFLAMLGHELRNPLSAIASAVEVLNRVDAGSETAGNARTIISRQTRNLAHLMDDLLDVARVISGKILLTRQAIDVAALVERLVATLKVTGAGGQHELTMDLSEAWVDADATRVEQVVNNLITNALKYTPSGGRVSVSVRREAASVWLEVSDTGVGIPPALLPRIFDLFVQGERTLDRRAGGLGIGLTLVRRLVELHGGNVSVDSSTAGSTFRIRLDAIEAPSQRAPVVQRSRRPRCTVGVIEDNPDALEALRSILELMGHTVETASDGERGLAMLLATRPEIAVVDIGLPGLTGLEVAKNSRAAGYAGRMIALSGYGQASDVRRAMVAGFDAYLVKPVDAAELERLMIED